MLMPKLGAKSDLSIQRQLPIAKNIHFFPPVMETYGFTGKEIITFTQKIESAFKRNCGKENLAAFKTAFKYDLSCVLQQVNAQLLQQGFSTIGGIESLENSHIRQRPESEEYCSSSQQHIRNDKL
jgi:hypothetical protein